MLPSKLKNFNLFNDAQSYLGVCSALTPPKIAVKGEAYRGAGGLGEVDYDLGLEKLEMEATYGGLVVGVMRQMGMVRVDGVVFFQVLDAAKAAYEVNNLEFAILNLTMTNVRTVMGSMDLDELLSKRDEINARLLTVVDEATTPWGVKVTRIEIKDIAPPKDLVDSMARQMKAERDKRAAILTAEGERQAAILAAEGQKQAAILEAEGRKESAYRDAEARERLAQAEARATLMLSEAIGKGNVQAINYFVAQKYVEAVGKLAVAPNQKVLLMPLDTSGLVGAIAGVAELAQEALSKTGARS